MNANIAMHEGIKSILDRSIDYAADTIKVILLTNTYTENKDDQFIDAGGASDMVDARVAGTTDQTLSGKAFGRDTTGDFAYMDANDPTWTGVTAGSTAGKIGVYKDTGTPTTSKILGVLDIADITTNGGDITLNVAAPASGGLLKFAV